MFGAGYGIQLHRFMIIAFLSTLFVGLKNHLSSDFQMFFAAHFAKHLWLNIDKKIFHLLNNPGECILRGHFQHISLNTCSFGLVLDLKAFILVRYVGVKRYIHVI